MLINMKQIIVSKTPRGNKIRCYSDIRNIFWFTIDRSIDRSLWPSAWTPIYHVLLIFYDDLEQRKTSTLARFSVLSLEEKLYFRFANI